eukprot:GHVS01086410.1.p1 GENE.GHVS01086410.1~~GHVS01086410.1.p1  ORF type:complete len:128 (+),score=19.33 GHVS01086410.1:824-1207(+)
MQKERTQEAQFAALHMQVQAIEDKLNKLHPSMSFASELPDAFPSVAGRGLWRSLRAFGGFWDKTEEQTNRQTGHDYAEGNQHPSHAGTEAAPAVAPAVATAEQLKKQLLKGTIDELKEPREITEKND